jgi:hypothetical protein
VVSHPPDPDEPLPTSEDWGRMVGSQRGDQYTPMGEVWMFGDFASGLQRDNHKRWVRVTLVALALAGVLMIVALVVALISSL